MNLKMIRVELLAKDSDVDVLRFFLSEDPLDVNLNSSDCQSSLKSIFSSLLEKLISEDLVLKFEVSDGYDREMYIEVCTEYINDLNRELNEIKEDLRNELK